MRISNQKIVCPCCILDLLTNVNKDAFFADRLSFTYAEYSQLG